MRKLPSWAAFGVAGLAAWLGLGSYGLMEPSDARYAEIAREMWASGDYLFPRLLGIHHFHKPPLAYWATTLGYRIFGVSEWGARAALGAFALLLALVLWDFARRHLEAGAAPWVVVAAATTPALVGAGRSVTTDLLLALLLSAALCAWFDVWSGRGGRGRLTLFYAAAGLAFLTKGPVAWLLLALVLVPFAWFRRREAPTRRCSWGLAWGVPLALLLALPWYGYVIAKTPTLLSYFLKGQLASRLGESGMGHPRPWHYFVVVFPALGLPWIALALRGWRALPAQAPGLRAFVGLWAAAPPLFFSLPATKLALYPLLAYPALALLAGAALGGASPGSLSFFHRVSGAFLAALGAGVAALGTGLVPPAGAPAGNLAAAALPAALGLAAAALAAAALPRRHPLAATLSLAAALALLPGWAALHADDLPLPTARPVAVAAARELLPGDALVEYRTLASGVPFYAGRLPLLAAVGRERQFEEDAKDERTISLATFRSLWGGTGRVLAITRPKRIAELPGARELARGGGFVLLANR